MMILAIDSSAKPASVAVCSNGELLGQYFQNNGLTHSRTLLSMTDSLLKNLNVRASEIDIVAVSRGPGSFTGVRIGVSAAKGFAWGADKQVCGVSTLEAMAYQIPEPGLLICPVMDARRGQVYNALFEWKDGTVQRLCDDRAISLDDLATELLNMASKNKNTASPETSAIIPNSEFRIPNSHVFLVGDGAAISYEHLSSAGIQCSIAPVLLRNQTAYGVALAAIKTEPINAIELEPSYLRPSQAEREMKRSSTASG